MTIFTVQRCRQIGVVARAIQAAYVDEHEPSEA